MILLFSRRVLLHRHPGGRRVLDGGRALRRLLCASQPGTSPREPGEPRLIGRETERDRERETERQRTDKQTH